MQKDKFAHRVLYHIFIRKERGNTLKNAIRAAKTHPVFIRDTFLSRTQQQLSSRDPL